AKLDSKNKQTKTSSDSLTLKKIKARSANLVSPPNSQCKKAESTHAAVRVSAFLQRVGKAGLSPFEDKSGYFFCHKRNFWGARGGGFALFCAKDSQKTKNDLLKNSDFRKVDSIESNNPKDSKKLGNIESKNVDSKKNNVDVSLSLNMTKNIESRFYKNSNFTNLDSIKTQNQDSKNAHLPTPLTPLRKGGENPTLTFQNIKNVNYITESKLKDSKEKLGNIESRFYKNIEFWNLDSKKVMESNLQNFKKIVNLDSKTQNSHSHFLCKSIPTRPPFFKINIKSANANFANNVNENIESKNVDSKKNNVDVSLSLNMTKNIESRFYKNSNFTNLDSIKTQNQDSKNAHLPTPLTPLRKGGENPTLTFQNIKNVNYITESKLKDSKEKLENIESRFYENIEISNLDFKKVIKSNIQDSKKIVNLDSKMQNSHSHFLCKSIPT
ncbi:hypothetical protein, partial [Helicobacter saguini]|uniref:hypothetical protein n=1 Tax=Helicobacter saguini TaxID=1548018 RepID=UPI001386B03B